MGNNSSSPRAPSTSPNPSKPLPTLGPDGGHCISVTGIYHEFEWDAPAVTRLILNRALAPFYRGLQDEWSSEITREALGQQLDVVGRKEVTEETVNYPPVPERRREDERHKRAEVEAYERGTVECPICFLYVSFCANFKWAINRAVQKLSRQYQLFKVLRPANLYRMFCPDQTSGTNAYASRGTWPSFHSLCRVYYRVP